jgi:hypothetical protein
VDPAVCGLHEHDGKTSLPKYALSILVGVALVCAWGPSAAAAALGLAEKCPNATLRQGPSASLPECRVYEQVTPVNKGDAIDLFPVQALAGSTDVGPARVDAGVAAEDGNQFLLRGSASIGPGAPTSVASYVFSRGADGWTMATLDPPVARPQTVKAELFDPANLSSIGFSDLTGSADADLLSHDESGVQLASLVGPAGGPYSTRASVSGSAALDSAETGINLVGGSENLGHVILESENHELAPEAEFQVPFSHALYESIGGGECGVLIISACKLVNVDNGGEPLTCGATLGQLGGEGEQGGAHEAVSTDGSRIFFTAPDPNVINGELPTGPGCWNHSSNSAAQENPPELYMRENGARTVELSVPEEGGMKISPENPLEPAVFVGASANGSRVFFITKTELTSDDRWHAPELYEYNAEAPNGERLVRVSRGNSESSPAEGDVDFVGAVSSDGATVYFTAFGALAPGAAALSEGKGETIFSAPVNLYSYSTLTGVTTYITTVNAGDFPVSLLGELYPWYHQLFSGGAEDLGLNARSEWYTTGDGQFLVFATEEPLTGYDNVEAPGAECEYVFPNVSSGKCLELYRYSAKENSIVCVSCKGGEPIDDAVFARAVFKAPSSGQPRPISEDGSDVFFDTASALVPQATPGKVHVYEWHEGTISMISSPSDPSDAFFLGSSADGSNVFFSTHAQLAPADTDQSTDVYDARVNGGFSELATPQCTGTGCQGVPAAPPIFATPASFTFEGVGNFPALPPPGNPLKRCRRGDVKNHDTCVKRKAKRPVKRATKPARRRR